MCPVYQITSLNLEPVQFVHEFFSIEHGVFFNFAQQSKQSYSGRVMERIFWTHRTVTSVQRFRKQIAL